MIIEYSGRRFLTDPMLGDKFAYEPLDGGSRNPVTGLPENTGDFLSDIDICVISHLHNDHFDKAAQEKLPKDIPVFCQPGDEHSIKSVGFTDARKIIDSVNYDGIEISRVPGQHGTGIWADHMGCVSGFVFKADDEPVVYWTGDTIWYDDIKKAIQNNKPDIIITHSGGASLGNSGPIIMDAEQTIELSQFSPGSIVVAVHMESLDHLKVSRRELRSKAEKHGISKDRLFIPNDGELLQF